MNQLVFTTSAHAKCVIAGEHIVLRGMPAVVFPVLTKKITINFKKNTDKPFQVSSISNKDEAFLQCFMQTLSHALNLIKMSKGNELPSGHFTLENNIPMGAGIGFSAALCVVIARWLMRMDFLKSKMLFSFSHSLENIFHGKSSGLDIAGVMSDFAVHYNLSGRMHIINPRWEPMLFISYSGEPKNTKIAIQHVQEVRKKNPKLAKLLDKEMQQSVLEVEEALNTTKKQGLPLLIEAIQQANHCFIEWNLITPSLQQHIDWLKELGAITVKPTGAGEGGYVLSLWNNPPPADTGTEFIPLFTNEDKIHPFVYARRKTG